MFSRFSPASMRVLRAAEQECRNHNHYYVGVGHVLLALLDEHDPALERALRARGLATRELRSELVRLLGTGDGRTWEGILVTPRVRAAVSAAEQLAGEGRDVEPTHLLSALLADDGGIVAEAVLQSAPRNPATVATGAPSWNT